MEPIGESFVDTAISHAVRQRRLSGSRSAVKSRAINRALSLREYAGRLSSNDQFLFLCFV